MTLEELLDDMDYSYSKDDICYSGFRIKIFPNDLQKKEIFAIFDACDWCYNKTIELYDKDNPISWYNMWPLVKAELKQNDQHKHLTDGIMKFSVIRFYDGINKMYKCGNSFPKKKNTNQESHRSFQVRTDRLRVGTNFVKVEHVTGEIKTGHNHIPLKPYGKSSTHEHLTYYQATVSYDGIDFWFSVTIEYPHEIITLFKKTPEKTDPIGIDVGVKISAMCSNGWKFHTPMDEKRVKRVSRIDARLARNHKNPAMALSEETGIPYEEVPKSKNTIKLEKRRLKDLRKTANKKKSEIHEFTAHLVKENPMAIVMENFSVEEMVKNVNNMDFRRELYAQCLYMIKDFTCSKCKRAGIPFVTADRNYPSTKRCSKCGNMDTNLMVVHSTRDRKFHCRKCGLVIDRDLNASYNLRDIVLDPNLYDYIYKIEYGGHTFIRKSHKEEIEE